MSKELNLEELKRLAPLPELEKSIAARALGEIYSVPDDELDLYLDQQLTLIRERNPVVASALTYIWDRACEANGEEAGQIALLAEIAMYRTLQNQTLFNYRKYYLHAKQLERSEENKKLKEIEKLKNS